MALASLFVINQETAASLSLYLFRKSKGDSHLRRF